MVAHGDELIAMSGRYLPEDRQIQDMNRTTCGCAKNVWGGDRALFPAISDKLYEVPNVGVIPEFYGRITENVGTRGIHLDVQKTPEVDTKLRKLSKQRKASECSKSKIRDQDGCFSTPSGLAGKKNPDRTASTEARLVYDLRAANRGFRKGICFLSGYIRS